MQPEIGAKTMKQYRDVIIEKMIFCSGILAIVFVCLIFGFLLKEGLAFFKEYGMVKFVFGRFWYPASSPAEFGILSLTVGSLFVTIGAACIAIPLGVMAALYISEVAPPSLRDILKSGVELLAAIPSVVIGFVGLVTLVPLVRTFFDVPDRIDRFLRFYYAGFHGDADHSFDLRGCDKGGSMAV